MLLFSFLLLTKAHWSFWLTSLAGTVVVVGLAAGPGQAQSIRATDSMQVKELCRPAQAIASRNPKVITRHQQHQLVQAAFHLHKWTDTYLPPSQTQEAVVLRRFRYLVQAGRYYATACYLTNAVLAYNQAEQTIPASSSLRAKVMDCVTDMIGVRQSIDAYYQAQSQPALAGNTVHEQVLMMAHLDSLKSAPPSSSTPPARALQPGPATPPPARILQPERPTPPSRTLQPTGEATADTQKIRVLVRPRHRFHWAEAL